MICVTTRFHLRHFWFLLHFYLFYKKMDHDLRSAPGLIRYAFLIQNPLVCYTFSIWESEQAIMKFSNTPNHIFALRQAKYLCQNIWSAYWNIDAVSKHANQWPGSVMWPLMVPHPIYPYRLVQQPNGKELS